MSASAPMSIYRTVVNQYGYKVTAGTLTAQVSGVQDSPPGSIAISDGAFGGPMWDDPRLNVQGSNADLGKPVVFFVDGATCGVLNPPNVTFQGGQVLQVALQLQEAPQPQPVQQPTGAQELVSLLEQALNIAKGL